MMDGSSLGLKVHESAVAGLSIGLDIVVALIWWKRVPFSTLGKLENTFLYFFILFCTFLILFCTFLILFCTFLILFCTF